MKYFDLHCDTASECFEKRRSLCDDGMNVSLKKAAGFQAWAQIFAVWIRDEIRGENAFRYLQDVAGYLKQEIEKNKDALVFCRSGADIQKAAQNSKGAALLSIEGGAALAGDLEKLREAKEMGVRLITLTWNGRCETGDGCMVPNAGGLTPFGREVVREMNRLNMIVDVSHLSERGFWDVARTATKPFVATHSDSKALCGHMRNLTDGQFREIVRDGGLVGLNFCGDFLRESRAGINDILRHADHFLHLGGEKALAVGSDFDGCKLVEGVGGMEDMERLYRLFCDEFGGETADAIFYRNAFRFFTENPD